MVYVSLVNIDLKNKQLISLVIADVNMENVTGEILTYIKLRDYNSFDNPAQSKPEVFGNFSLKKEQISVMLPLFSVVVLEK